MTHEELISNGFHVDDWDDTYRLGKYRFGHKEIEDGIGFEITWVAEYDNYHGVDLKPIKTIEDFMHFVSFYLR